MLAHVKGYSMQALDSEMVIYLKSKSLLKRSLLRFCISFLISVGLFSFLIILTLREIAANSQFPSLQEEEYHELPFLLLGVILVILVSILILLFMIRQLRIPAPYVRINQEGIF